MSLRVASYNVLADDYIKAERYPGVAEALLDPAWRLGAVAARAAGLRADILCLQEVERPMLTALAAAIDGVHLGYAPKPGRRDGVAIFARAPTVATQTILYPDDTARVALLVAIEHGGRRLGIANTHLKLDAAQGLAQAGALVDAIAAFEPACDGWIVCGDLNAPPSGSVLARLHAAGLHDPHDPTGDFTSNFAAGLKRIDYVLTSSSLRVTPVPPPPITHATTLPSTDEPSDHLPIEALVDWIS